MKSPVQPHHHDSTSVKVGEAELQNPHIKVALSSPVKNTMEIETGANIEPRSPIFDPHLSSTLHKMIANNQMDTSSSPGITIKSIFY